ncbi:hypothetical protein CVV68_08630 [Arthrobacter livingstonensis]|uniref:Uncharacterized protein n=1 Tax=Arthrobacter livingstonensis TaxID=670078 RepID=A0A2V5L8S7_9MICC|nr:hypothetical protein [Arthrobacter livingstonensis]PYI67915.1 hypothetical protein CVV68_08630 [Arthrobacter livingstonensis]
MIEPTSTTRRFELTLRKPWLGWFPRPTVVVNGVGQPAQWGTRNWKVPGDDTATVNIFLFNRWWKYGEVNFSVEPGALAPLVYSAPWLPFLPGRVRPVR